MTELVRYEAARRALAEAVAVDEVLQIRDQAEAMRQAARIAKDMDFEIKGAQLRFRAERRFGELMAAQKAAGLMAKGGRPRTEKTPTEREGVLVPEITLRDVGVDYKFSSKAQRMADLPSEKFEALLEQHADEMRTAKGRVAMDLLKVNADQDGREARRELAKTLSDASATLPTGRQYPVIYADPPWRRKQGVTSRSYENHYPTMTWDEICALPVKDIVLPDAWLFLWIPRAHAFALHKVQVPFPAGVLYGPDGEPVAGIEIEMPLAWAVARSWGFDAYSTAFVWTKTDEEHPDEAGGAVLVRDQDELLLMFKRGRGLPKPANGEKFGSNHRERSRPLGHSTKPQHFRRMIATMAGRDVPVLEMFARLDADNQPPPGWDLWGNQAQGNRSQEPAAQPFPAQNDIEGNHPFVDSGDASRSADQPAAPAASPTPDDRIVDTTADENPVRFETAVPPAGKPGSESPVPIELSEFDALKLISDFCDPRRSELLPQIGPEYAERGLAIEQSATGQWILRDAGWSRLRELEAERKACEPAKPVEQHPLDIPEFLRRAPKKPQIKVEPQLELALARIDRASAEIVDGKIQTRMPLCVDEPPMIAVLRAVDAGEIADSELVRHAESEGYLHVTTKSIRLTDEGRAYLAQLVDAPTASSMFNQEEASGNAVQ
jgi:N6-adenosine-specific RNA methylase IME4